MYTEHMLLMLLQHTHILLTLDIETFPADVAVQPPYIADIILLMFSDHGVHTRRKIP